MKNGIVSGWLIPKWNDRSSVNSKFNAVLDNHYLIEGRSIVCNVFRNYYRDLFFASESVINRSFFFLFSMFIRYTSRCTVHSNFLDVLMLVTVLLYGIAKAWMPRFVISIENRPDVSHLKADTDCVKKKMCKRSVGPCWVRGTCFFRVRCSTGGKYWYMKRKKWTKF